MLKKSKTFVAWISIFLSIFAWLMQSAPVFADTTIGKGELEFKLVDESVPGSVLQEWVDQARRERGIPDDSSFETLSRIRQALREKTPAGSSIYFEMAPSVPAAQPSFLQKLLGTKPKPLPPAEPQPPRAYLLKDKVELSGAMLSRVELGDNEGKPFVSLAFNPEGTKRFAEITRQNLKHYLAILIDSQVLAVPQIYEPISNGLASIHLGSYESWEEARALTKSIVERLRLNYRLQEKKE